MQPLVPIREIVNLNGLEEVIDGLAVRNERGDDHEGARVGVYPLGIVETGKELRAGDDRREPIDDGDRQLAEAEEKDGREGREHAIPEPEVAALDQDGRRAQGRHAAYPPQIKHERKPKDRPLKPHPDWPPKRAPELELGSPSRNEVVADMGRPVRPALVLGAVLREL